jgi:mRNA interferase MazF
MPDPGDVVIVTFPGAEATKRRPAVVLSTRDYHQQHPDVILGILTSQISKATTLSDYVLLDYQIAGLHQPTAFRSYILTFEQRLLSPIGHLSPWDWRNVQICLAKALSITGE